MVPVAGIGDFRFRQRTFRDQFRIEIEAHRLLDGEPDPPAGLRLFAVMLATLVTLLESAPAGFDLDELDPLDADAFRQLEEVYAALRSAEDAFRGRFPVTGEGNSEGTSASDAHLVPGSLQPPAK